MNKLKESIFFQMTILLFGLSFFNIVAAASENEECKLPYQLKDIDDFVYESSRKYLDVELIAMGRLDKLIVRIEKDAAYHIENIFSYIDSGCEVDAESERKFYSMTRVFAVMHEKKPRLNWENEKNLLKIFEEVKKMDVEHTKTLRKRDWSESI